MVANPSEASALILLAFVAGFMLATWLDLIGSAR